MPTLSLRILIVDDHPAQCLNIERMLNHQGYYRIAPATSFDQLIILLDCVAEPFDLLVINRNLTAHADFNSDYLFKFCPMIRHVLVYESCPCDEKVQRLEGGSKLIKKLSRPPDICTIETFMQVIDPGRVEPAGMLTNKNCRRPC